MDEWVTSMNWLYQHWSKQSDDDEAVQFLLDLIGVNVNYSNSEGQTALILASEAGQQAIVWTARANINHHDNNGLTALMVSKTTKIFLLLLQPNADIEISIHESLTRQWSRIFNRSGESIDIQQNS